MHYYRHHIFFCLNQRDSGENACAQHGAQAGYDHCKSRIKAERLKALTLGNSDAMQVGDFVVAIGSPFGLRQTATTGIISGLGRATGGGSIEDFIQTDASINPGNSGGALINLRGELVGVPSQILSRSGGNIGIGFAIPVNLAKNVMAQLIETGSVTRGRIGVQGQDITPELAKSFGLPTARGVVVSRVVPRRAAMAARGIPSAHSRRERPLMSEGQLAERNSATLSVTGADAKR